MIKIIPNKKSKKAKDPYYIVKHVYMIGDVDGETSEKVEVSIDNPYVERYVKLLNKLEPTEGTWGLSLDMETMYDCFKEGQITKDEYIFLVSLMFECSEYDEFEDEINAFRESPEFERNAEFYDIVRSNTEYSFLTLEYVDLKYVNEFGEKFDTEIVD